jgi:flavin reductase (DIM6/NTAB) family NADH-FMN oxidoreductase RutF
MTTTVEDQLVGLTANSFSSLSMDPPLILWSVGRSSRSFSAFSACRHFAVNVLSSDQVAASQHFSSSSDRKFDGVSYRLGALGSPVLSGILALFECGVEKRYEGGDHIILVGRVRHYAQYSGDALIYSQGRYVVAQEHPAP